MGIRILLLSVLVSSYVLPLGLLAGAPFPGEGPFAKEIKYLAIHHTEVSASDNNRQLDSVNEYHRRRFASYSYLRKWGGYNAFIDVDGTLSWYRLYGEKTAAQLAHNFDTISVCMAGNFNKEMPTKEQVKTLAGFLYNYPGLIVVFHRDLAERTCPGTNLNKAWLAKILAEHSAGGSLPPPKIHMGRPNLSAGDSLLREMEHEQSRQKYRELLKMRETDVVKFERSKLKLVVDELDRRTPKRKRKKNRRR